MPMQELCCLFLFVCLLPLVFLVLLALLDFSLLVFALLAFDGFFYYLKFSTPPVGVLNQ
jgi:hypothetical protein